MPLDLLPKLPQCNRWNRRSVDEMSRTHLKMRPLRHLVNTVNYLGAGFTGPDAGVCIPQFASCEAVMSIQKQISAGFWGMACAGG